MSSARSAVDVVRAAYEAFGRGDVPAILEMLAEPVDWKFVGARRLPYTGTFRTRAEIGRWFASIAEVDDIQAFEPREFLSAGEHVTVLGWEKTTARPSGKVFDAEWVHVFTVRDGKVVRFFGMYDTEASALAR